jgi:multidrug resistance protein, MATE family
LIDFRKDLRKISSISFPLTGMKFLHALTAFINVAFISHLGQIALAGSSLFSVTISTILLFCWSIFYSVGVIAGNYFGSGEIDQVGRVVKQGFLVAIVLGLFFSLVVWNLDRILLFFHQRESLVRFITPYFHYFCWGVLPSILYMCFCQFVSAIGRARLVFFWTLVNAPLALFLSYALLFGKFGFLKMGLAGAALGWSLSYILVTAGIIIYFLFSEKYAVYHLFSNWFKGGFCQARKILKIGLPIGFQMGSIMSVYTFLTYMVGWMGESSLAANQVMGQCLTLVSMIPYGISQGAGILVAQALGEKRRQLKTIYYAGIFLVVGLVLLTSLSYWFAPRFLTGIFLYTKNAENFSATQLAKSLLLIGGFLQIVDALAMTFLGILRGFHDTRIPMLINILVNWGLIIPLGYFFAFHLGLGVIGIYLALLTGVSVNVGCFVWRLTKLHKCSII